MKYTKEERLDIGRRIYEGEFSRYTAAEAYDISEQTARNYVRMYRGINHLPPKHDSRGIYRSITTSSPPAQTRAFRYVFCDFNCSESTFSLTQVEHNLRVRHLFPELAPCIEKLIVNESV